MTTSPSPLPRPFQPDAPAREVGADEIVKWVSGAHPAFQERLRWHTTQAGASYAAKEASKYGFHHRSAVGMLLGALLAAGITPAEGALSPAAVRLEQQPCAVLP